MTTNPTNYQEAAAGYFEAERAGEPAELERAFQWLRAFTPGNPPRDEIIERARRTA